MGNSCTESVTTTDASLSTSFGLGHEDGISDDGRGIILKIEKKDQRVGSAFFDNPQKYSMMEEVDLISTFLSKKKSKKN